MRLIKTVLIMGLGYSNLAICQSELSITPYFCQSWGDKSIYDHQIRIYREGELTSKEFYPKNDFTVGNLLQGRYLVKYNTIFNQEFQLEIDLDETSKSVDICVDDYTQIQQRTYVEALKANEILEIWAYETGCEYTDFGKIHLVKNGQNFEATFINGKERTQKILSERELRLIEEIEHKIHLIRANEEDGFLRTYHYEIRLNGEEKIVTKFGVEGVGYALKMKEIFDK